jgi:hypothetical protein
VPYPTFNCGRLSITPAEKGEFVGSEYYEGISISKLQIEVATYVFELTAR